MKAVTGDEFEKYLVPTRLLKMSWLSTRGDMGRAFLYDDPIFGVFSVNLLFEKFRGNIAAHFEKVYKEIKAFLPEVSKENKTLFTYALTLADLLRLKSGFRKELYLAHKAGSKDRLRKLLKVVPLLKKKYEAMCKAQRKIWLLERKPEGLEALDVRYGSQLKRLDVAAERIKDYLSGKIKRISELEETPRNIYSRTPYRN